MTVIFNSATKITTKHFFQQEANGHTWQKWKQYLSYILVIHKYWHIKGKNVEWKTNKKNNEMARGDSEIIF